MSEYTPTTEEVEHYYDLARYEWSPGDETTGEQRRAEFRRWLVAEKAKWQAEALRDAASAYRSGQLTGVFLGRDDYPRAWLNWRADRIRKGFDDGR